MGHFLRLRHQQWMRIEFPPARAGPAKVWCLHNLGRAAVAGVYIATQISCSHPPAAAVAPSNPRPIPPP
ncbi:hypothetical protein [Terriglobus roseus]|uniref:hypothetical protein n=1 Tax=Terriglobus roseus TaxID=392734 RepID=UPI0012F6BB48|nr:hypothetical protein [Terriglobus roseus]